MKEWGNIKHSKKLRPPYGCNFKNVSFRKNDQVCTDKKSKGHSHNGMGERTVFLQPWFVSAMHVVLYTFCFLYEQRVINKTEAIFGWILNNACISWIRDVIKMTRGVISPSPQWHTVFLSITYSEANSQTQCRTARI